MAADFLFRVYFEQLFMVVRWYRFNGAMVVVVIVDVVVIVVVVAAAGDDDDGLV